MATDYDAPRKNDDESGDDSIEELKGRRSEAAAPTVDEDEAEAADTYELPGADLSGEELSVRVLPRQADEFTCASCFLVKHRSQINHVEGTLIICKECAAACTASAQPDGACPGECSDQAQSGGRGPDQVCGADC